MTAEGIDLPPVPPNPAPAREALLNATLGLWDAPMREWMVAKWVQTGMPPELLEEAFAIVVQDVREQAADALRATLFPPTETPDLAGAGPAARHFRLINDVLRVLFNARSALHIACLKLFAAEAALAHARAQDPAPQAPPPPGLRDIIPPR